MIMKKTLDLRGLSCPIPLLKTRDALAQADMVEVLVDELPPKENILKFAKSQNYKVEWTESGGEYRITVSK
ncbi:MAG: sulfurtransferase TusA family protein [Negativicutes bacterium]|nr:sulfurtransferase TusA family protein [Negativicutes bacterium]